MLEEYGAPYVLDKFALHFTLLSELPDDEEERRNVEGALSRLLEPVLADQPRVTVGELCLVVRPRDGGPWQIKGDTFPLSRS